MSPEIQKPVSYTTQKAGLILGPAMFLLMIPFFDLEPKEPILTGMAASAVLMADWWITDAIPLFATSLLLMILYSLSGVVLIGDLT